jgi:Rieske Fe-S protein
MPDLTTPDVKNSQVRTPGLAKPGVPTRGLPAAGDTPDVITPGATVVDAPAVDPATMTRRGMLVKIGLLVNVAVAATLAVPIVRYLLSSISRGRGGAYLEWVPLGSVDRFPEGETRLATFRNPLVMPSDGKTVDTACWVRRVSGDTFQVFAVNCAHLGCPVRWFPQSGLFMCPCHGGAYYRDGARASGPPERGLFVYPSRVQNRILSIQAGQLPTPGGAKATVRG